MTGKRKIVQVRDTIRGLRPERVAETLSGQIQAAACVMDVLLLRHDAPVPTNFGEIETIRAIIDTGAQCSTIRADIAAKLNLLEIDQGRVAGVGGQPFQAPIVVATIVLAKEIKGAGLGRNSFSKQMRFYSLPQDKHPSAMLFGMSALEGGQLTVNPSAGRWWFDIIIPR